MPPFTSRKLLASRIVRLRENEGRALLLHRGQGTEFDSLRSYVAGDDVRAIDWRSTARRGETLVRTWRPERDRHVVIVLDSGRAGSLRSGTYPAFDTYIESALLLSAVATAAGDRAHVFCVDTEVKMRLTGLQGPHVSHKLARALAEQEPTLALTNWQELTREINRAIKQPALVVLLTGLNVSSVSDGLLEVLPQLSQRHRLMVASLDRTLAIASNQALDAKNQFDASDNLDLAVARTRLELQALRQLVKAGGAQLVLGSEEALPALVTDTYLGLKAQGKL